MNIEEQRRSIRKEYRKNFLYLSCLILVEVLVFGYSLFYESLKVQLALGIFLLSLLVTAIIYFQERMKNFVKRLPD